MVNWGSEGLAFELTNGCCGGTSHQVVLVKSAMMLPVSATKNAVPVAGSLSPASATHGGGNLQVTINGSGFVPGSQVTWDGSPRTVSYVSSSQLIAYIPGSDIAAAGAASVVVANPTPGGGKSNTLTFTIQ